MPHTSRFDFVRFIPSQLFTYGSELILTGGFLTSLYLSKGLDEAQVGLVSSLTTAACIFGYLFFGRLCDRMGRRKPVMLVCYTLAVFCALGVYMVTSPHWVMALGVLCGFFFSVLPSILDAWVLAGLGEGRSHLYSIIRLFGSLGYSIVSVIYGKFITLWGWQVMPLFLLVFLGLSFAVFLPLGEAKTEPSVQPQTKQEKRGYALLLKNRPYVALVLVISLLSLGNGAFYTFLPLLVERVGGTTADLGTASMIQAMAEIPVFIVLTYVARRIRPDKIIALSIAIFVLRYALLLMVKTVAGLFWVLPLQGIGYALYLPSLRICIASLAPKGLETSAQTASDAISGSLMGIITGVGSGVIIKYLGYDTLMYISMGLAAAALVLFLVLVFPAMRQTGRESET